MEVEMEFAGRLKKIRIKLIMIGICLIFLGGYSLIQEWKDQKKNTTKKGRNFWNIRFSVVADSFQNFFQNRTVHEESSLHFYIQSAILFRIVFFFDIPDAAYF